MFSKGLVVRSPWIELILDGRKTWEIRGSNTKIRGKIGLIKSGSGLIFGSVDIIDAKPLTVEELRSGLERHCIPVDTLNTSKYARPHAWVLSNAVRFKNPIPYVHPQGAVIWVDLGGFMEKEKQKK